MVQAARDLVDRARRGDQNAMALLQRVGEESRKGVARARVAEGIIRAYIAHTPPTRRTPAPQFTGEIIEGLKTDTTFKQAIFYALACENGEDAVIVALANGPILFIDAQLLEIGNSYFGSDTETEGFFYGVRYPHEDHVHRIAQLLPPEAHTPYALGRCVGAARAIQALRVGEGRIQHLSPAAAWELGEEVAA